MNKKKLFLINYWTETFDTQPIPESISYTNTSALYDFGTLPYLTYTADSPTLYQMGI